MVKRGDKRAATIPLETVIFIVLNLIVFLLLLVFVRNSANGALVYEQAYSKQIALFIDEAKPEMSLMINMEKALEIAKDKNPEDIVKIDETGNRVIVSLGSSGGYSYQYFTNYAVEKNFNGIYLFLKIKEKSNGVTNAAV